jgi:hypothetical protein
LTVSLVTPAAAIAVGVYVGTRLPPNYSVARSTACWRAHGYRVSPVEPDFDPRGFTSIEIRGHHDVQYVTFAPNQVTAWSWADDANEGSSDYYEPPPVPVRNVVFGGSGTFDDQPVIACLRTRKD